MVPLNKLDITCTSNYPANDKIRSKGRTGEVHTKTSIFSSTDYGNNFVIYIGNTGERKKYVFIERELHNYMELKPS
jgi:hypothetical protein